MNDSTTEQPAARPVLDVWCELQCPDCRAALDDLRALRTGYGDRLDVRLRHFPLDKHRHAFAAAQAAEEAMEQGRGWPYVEAVLGRVAELDRKGEPFLVEVARELGLDAEQAPPARLGVSGELGWTSWVAPKKPEGDVKIYFRDARFDPMARRAATASTPKQSKRK